MKEYYLLSLRHASKKDFALLFWGPNDCGYTYNIDDAGVYTEGDLEVGKEYYNNTYTKPIEKHLIIKKRKFYVIDRSKLGHIVLNNCENRACFSIAIKDFCTNETGWDERVFVTPKDFLAMHKKIIEICEAIKSLYT